MFLPAMTLAIGSIAVYQRLLRADMVATLEEDFIVMARAKGLTNGRILFRHALRPSTFTVMTVGGVQIGSLIAGAVIAEQVFALHGLGSVLLAAVSAKDLPTVQDVTIIVAIFYIVCNILIDLLYTVIDPRVRRARAS
jgi:peptide/nickel transport system permease protein